MKPGDPGIQFLKRVMLQITSLSLKQEKNTKRE